MATRKQAGGERAATFSSGERKQLQRRLLAWYRASARQLPWRDSRDPYAIWLSEVMLQQTRVETVKPFWRRFLEQLPTLPDLAAAPQDQVLGLWSGLGYYARARALHRAAQLVVAEHGGQLPADAAALAELPGFGPYTTAAVASIAFGLPEACVDGNVARVLARWSCTEGDPRTPAAMAGYRGLAKELLPRAEAGDFNQALMELGATLCGPGRPACLACPVTSLCRARRAGRQDELPPRKVAKERQRLRLVAALVVRGDELLLAQRPATGLFASLWELPAVEVEEGQEHRQALEQALAGRLGLRAAPGAELGSVAQTLTHRELELTVYEVNAPARFRPKALAHYVAARFASPADPPGGLSAVTRKALAQVWPRGT